MYHPSFGIHNSSSHVVAFHRKSSFWGSALDTYITSPTIYEQDMFQTISSFEPGWSHPQYTLCITQPPKGESSLGDGLFDVSSLATAR